LHRIGDGFHLRFGENAIIDGNCLDVGSICIVSIHTLMIPANIYIAGYWGVIGREIRTLKADSIAESPVASNAKDAMIGGWLDVYGLIAVEIVCAPAYRKCVW